MMITLIIFLYRFENVIFIFNNNKNDRKVSKSYILINNISKGFRLFFVYKNV